jgi:hypothetical protein
MKDTLDRYRKISNRYWIHINPATMRDDQQEWEKVKGRKLVIKGYEEFDIFVYRNIYGDWCISEGITGQAFITGEFTRADAIKETIAKLRGKEHLKRVIRTGIGLGGISPRYTDPLG